MARVIRAQLEGSDAEPGRVAAADVARIILGLERAIARAAYLVLGRRGRRTGRHVQVIESAARLRFIGVERGSFVELLALPDSTEPTDDELPISVADLSSQAFGRLLEVITKSDHSTDAVLAAAIAQMATELGIGDRNTSITLSDESGGAYRGERGSATIDVSVRERMQRVSSQRPATKDQTLVGVLVEADFERNTARLRLPHGDAVIVNFSSELADSIQEALRVHARVEGLVQYDARTAVAISVELRSVVRNTQLALDVESFWRTTSFSELQTEQHTTGRVDAADLAMAELTDDERAAFLAALTE